jgi:hypothetical protein
LAGASRSRPDVRRRVAVAGGQSERPRGRLRQCVPITSNAVLRGLDESCDGASRTGHESSRPSIRASDPAPRILGGHSGNAHAVQAIQSARRSLKMPALIRP